MKKQKPGTRNWFLANHARPWFSRFPDQMQAGMLDTILPYLGTMCQRRLRRGGDPFPGMCILPPDTMFRMLLAKFAARKFAINLLAGYARGLKLTCLALGKYEETKYSEMGSRNRILDPETNPYASSPIFQRIPSTLIRVSHKLSRERSFVYL